MKKIFYTFSISLSLSLAVFAQQAENSAPTTKAENLKTEYSISASKNDLVVPPDKGAWAIFVLTSGGFSGQGKGNLTLVSNGHLSDTKNSLSNRRFDVQSLKPLTDLISKLTIAQDATSLPLDSKVSPASFCRDCYQTTLIIYRREMDGTVKNLKVDWDDSTRDKISEDILRLYEKFTNLTSVKKL